MWAGEVAKAPPAGWPDARKRCFFELQQKLHKHIYNNNDRYYCYHLLGCFHR